MGPQIQKRRRSAVAVNVIRPHQATWAACFFQDDVIDWILCQEASKRKQKGTLTVSEGPI